MGAPRPMDGEDRRADRVLLDQLVGDLVGIGERMESTAARFEELAVLTSRVDAIERRQKDVIGPEGLLSRVKVLEALRGSITTAALAAWVAVGVSIITLVWMNK